MKTVEKVKEEIVPTSYKACIDDDGLDSFMVAEWKGASSIDKMT